MGADTLMQTRSRAKKQKLGHDPSDPEDSPTGRLRKNAALKAQSAQKSARSAEICPWGPQGRITTDRGYPPPDLPFIRVDAQGVHLNLPAGFALPSDL